MINVNYNLSKIIVRPMELDDLEEVLNIEKKSFPNPWTYNIFYYELTQNKYAKYFVLEKIKRLSVILDFGIKVEASILPILPST